MDSISMIGSTLSAGNVPAPFCVVCGKISTDLEVRKTGLKCPGCVGKRAKRAYSRLQQQQFTALVSQQMRGSTMSLGFANSSEYGRRNSLTGGAPTAFATSDASASSYEDPVAGLPGRRRHSIANADLGNRFTAWDRGLTLDDGMVPPSMSAAERRNQLILQQRRQQQEAEASAKASNKHIPEYINETSCYKAATRGVLLPEVTNRASSNSNSNSEGGNSHRVTDNGSQPFSDNDFPETHSTLDLSRSTSSQIVPPTTRYDETTRTVHEATISSSRRLSCTGPLSTTSGSLEASTNAELQRKGINPPAKLPRGPPRPGHRTMKPILTPSPQYNPDDDYDPVHEAKKTPSASTSGKGIPKTSSTSHTEVTGPKTRPAVRVQPAPNLKKNIGDNPRSPNTSVADAVYSPATAKPAPFVRSSDTEKMHSLSGASDSNNSMAQKKPRGSTTSLQDGTTPVKPGKVKSHDVSDQDDAQAGTAGPTPSADDCAVKRSPEKTHADGTPTPNTETKPATKTTTSAAEAAKTTDEATATAPKVYSSSHWGGGAAPAAANGDTPAAPAATATAPISAAGAAAAETSVSTQQSERYRQLLDEAAANVAAAVAAEEATKQKSGLLASPDDSTKVANDDSDSSEDEDAEEVARRKRRFSVQRVVQPRAFCRGDDPAGENGYDGSTSQRDRNGDSSLGGMLVDVDTTAIDLDQLEVTVEVPGKAKASALTNSANLTEDAEDQSNTSTSCQDSDGPKRGRPARGKAAQIRSRTVSCSASPKPQPANAGGARRGDGPNVRRARGTDSLSSSFSNLQVNSNVTHTPPPQTEAATLTFVIAIVDRVSGIALTPISRLYYTEIVPVYEEMKQLISSLPDLPTKRIPSKKYALDSFVENHRAALEEFLRQVLRNAFLVRHPRIVQLLRLEAFLPSADGAMNSSRSERIDSRRSSIASVSNGGDISSRRSGQPRRNSMAEPYARISSSASQCSHTSAARRDAMDDITQEELEKVQLGNLIGRGTFGSVYLGLLPSSSMLIAVKIMKVRDHVDSSALQATQRELDILRSARHTNIIRFLGSSFTGGSTAPEASGTAAGAGAVSGSSNANNNTNNSPSTTSGSGRELYIYSEYVECGTVAGMVKRFGCLPLQVVQRYMRQIVRGVHYLHEMGIVHRDIKGENMLVTKKGKVKLADFGCAETLREVDPNKGLIGSPQWMAPEVLNCDTVGPPVDIWAVGCVGIEMLQRKIWNLEEGPNPFAYLYHVSKMNSPPHGIPSDEELETYRNTEAYESFASFHNFLTSCLKVKPEERLTASQLSEHPFLYMPIPKGLRWKRKDEKKGV